MTGWRPRKFGRAVSGLGKVLAAFALLVIGGFLVSMMLPVKAWRTGENPVRPLALEPGQPLAAKPIRVWIDTDAACGRDGRTDPDDCLAILLLAQSGTVEIAGISTVFGNAPLSVTDTTTRSLMTELRADAPQLAPVLRGSAAALRKDESQPEPSAHQQFRNALQEQPLTIIALGPLTNVAAALRDRPDLQARVTEIVAVMGRRKGHLFHPVEGGTAGSFLGHGPVFSDLNFALDPDGAAIILGMKLPLTLIPYEAARDVMIGQALLDGMASRGGAAAWVAQRSRSWLAYWRETINKPGFYPFDLLASAYLIDPSLLQCAEVSVAVGDDTGVLGWLGFGGLFVVTADEPAIRPVVTGNARYCPEANVGLDLWLSMQLTVPNNVKGAADHGRHPLYGKHHAETDR